MTVPEGRVVPETPVVPTPGTAAPRVAVKALIVRDGHVLMNRVLTADGSVLHGPPGGGQEHGEDQVTALQRECLEEIGAPVEVHQVACVYEVQSTTRLRDGARIAPFHQVNVAYWCGLAPGREPSVGSDPDPDQVGTDWLPIGRLDEYDVRPLGLSQWLESDPSCRPVGLGTLSLGGAPARETRDA